MLSRRKQIIVTVCAVLIGVVFIGVEGVWFIIQSNWFKDKVRARVVSEVERTTGGRVELGGFTYDWHTLTATFTNFAVHGTEPATSPSLLRIDSLQVRLKIVSLLERDVDIAALVVTHPEINLLRASDGTTNIPAPRSLSTHKTAVQALLDLKVGHFDLTQGILHLNDRRVELDFRAEQVSLLASYVSRRHTPPNYEVSLSSRALRIGSKWVHPVPFQIDAKARLERDRAVFQQLVLVKDSSTVRAAGTIEHFANPRFDFQAAVDAAANDLGEFTVFQDLHGGRLLASGASHYDSAGGFSFTGQAGARQASYITKWFVLKDVTLDSAVAASASGLKFSRVLATTHGAKFTGDASVKQYRDLQIDGNASGLPLSEINAYLPISPLPKPLAWSGIAAGKVHLAVTLDPHAANFMLETRMHINPAGPAIPVSGDVGLAFHQRGNVLEFNDSRLNLPNSQVSFAGIPSGQATLALDSTNLVDFKPLLAIAHSTVAADLLPELLSGGTAHFDGTLKNVLNPEVAGQVALTHFRLRGQVWDRLRARVSAAAAAVNFESLDLQQAAAHLSGAGGIGLQNWSAQNDSPIRLAAQFQGVNVVKSVAEFSAVNLPIIGGVAAGSLQLGGSLGHPQGSAHISSDSLDAYGQRLNQIQFDASLAGDELQITRGHINAGVAELSFSGAYRHLSESWRRGEVHVKAESNGFPLADLSPVRKFAPGLNAQTQVHFEAAAQVSPGHIAPLSADGTVEFHKVAFGAISYGDLTLTLATRQQVLKAVITGDLHGTPLRGNAELQLAAVNHVAGEVSFDRLNLATIYALYAKQKPAGLEGFAQGALKFDGVLDQPERLHATLQIADLQVSSQVQSNNQAPTQAKPPDLVFRNSAPIVVEAVNGRAEVRSFQIAGKNTSLAVSGSFAAQNIDLKVAGAADLQIFNLFDPNVTSAGLSTVSAAISGTLRDPLVSGTLELKDGSFFLQDAPNGLSAVNGTVTFNRNRATLQKMTATSGGGELSLGGFVSFGSGGPLVYHLEGSAQNVRVRYAGSISVTANSSLRLSGTSTSSILSGTLTISRVVFNPNTDVGNLLASFGGASASPVSDNEFLTGLHLDVSIESAPNLQVSTALSRDVEAEIALRLRGTPSHPVLLGSVAANQGDIKVFGTRYSINRGEVSFVNAVKIEPVLDLDLETQTRGVTVDITISGTFGKLNLNYRSDPPLQPRDIIALLTVGRAPNSTNASNAQAATDSSALQSGANTVLGQAISPVSNRLSKLFGITNIKIDPLVQGITNTPQARLTLEQQISRDITITYVTNLSQTSEQIFRLEWALNRQFSLIALRDDNGEFGIDFQYKKRFK